MDHAVECNFVQIEKKTTLMNAPNKNLAYQPIMPGLFFEHTSEEANLKKALDGTLEFERFLLLDFPSLSAFLAFSLDLA